MPRTERPQTDEKTRMKPDRTGQEESHVQRASFETVLKCDLNLIIESRGLFVSFCCSYWRKRVLLKTDEPKFRFELPVRPSSAFSVKCPACKHQIQEPDIKWDKTTWIQISLLSFRSLDHESDTYLILCVSDSDLIWCDFVSTQLWIQTRLEYISVYCTYFIRMSFEICYLSLTYSYKYNIQWEVHWNKFHWKWKTRTE